MWYMHEESGWWMLFGWVWFAVFWGIIIASGIWIAGKLSNRKSTCSALDIAGQRYARGEISREEFEQIRKDLS